MVGDGVEGGVEEGSTNVERRDEDELLCCCSPSSDAKRWDGMGGG